MFDREMYIAEKLKELEAAACRAHAPAPERPARPRRRVLGPAARVAGRQMRHFGQALEAWGRPLPHDTRA